MREVTRFALLKTKNEIYIVLPSFANPSALPTVSTRKSCSSIVCMGVSECSTISSPVNGRFMQHSDESNLPLIENRGRFSFCTKD